MNADQLTVQMEKRKHRPKVETRVTHKEDEFMGIKIRWGVNEQGEVYLFMDTSGFACTEIAHK